MGRLRSVVDRRRKEAGRKEESREEKEKEEEEEEEDEVEEEAERVGFRIAIVNDAMPTSSKTGWFVRAPMSALQPAP